MEPMDRKALVPGVHDLDLANESDWGLYQKVGDWQRLQLKNTPSLDALFEIK